MLSFWGGRYDRTFVDVRVFNQHADSNKTSSLSSTYLKHESEKRRMYEQRVREVREHHLSLSYCQLLEAWANKLLYSTNGSPPCCPRKGKLPIIY